GGHLTGRFCQVGGHLTGRFWRRPAMSSRADHDPRGLEIGARRLAAHAGGLFDTAERPAQPPQSPNLLSRVVSQDVGHADGRAWARPSRQRLGALLSHWPVFSCPRPAGFGCPPRSLPAPRRLLSRDSELGDDSDVSVPVSLAWRICMTARGTAASVWQGPPI